MHFMDSHLFALRLGPRVGGARSRQEPQGRDSGDEEELSSKVSRAC